MRWALAGAVVLFFLAGCTGFAASGDATVTPAPVPEPDRTTPTPEPPRGLDAEGIRGVNLLATGHRRALANRSYVFRERFVRRTVAGNGTRVVNRTETTVVEGPTTYRHRIVRRIVSDGRTVQRLEKSTYASGGSWYERRDDGTVEYAEGQVRFDRDKFAFEAGFYLTQYGTVDRSQVAVVERGGRRFYRVTGSGGEFPGYPNPDQYRISLLVGPDGLVHRFGVATRTVENGTVERVRYRFWYTRLDGVEASEPAWLGNRSEGDR